MSEARWSKEGLTAVIPEFPRSQVDLENLNPTITAQKSIDIARHLDNLWLSQKEEVTTTTDSPKQTTQDPLLQSTPIEQHISEINPHDILKTKQRIKYDISNADAMDDEDSECDSGSDLDETPSKTKSQRDAEQQELKLNRALKENQELRGLKEYLLSQQNGKEVLEGFLTSESKFKILRTIELKEQNDRNEEVFQKLQDDFENLAQKHETLQTTILGLQEEAAALKEKNATLEDSLKEKETALECLNKQADSTREKEKEWAVALNGLKRQISDSSKLLLEKDSAIKCLEKDLDDIKSDSDIKQRSITNLGDKLKTSESSMLESNKLLAEIRKELSETKAELEVSNDKIKLIEKQESTIVELNTNIKDLKEKFETLQKTNNELSTDFETLQEANNELKTRKEQNENEQNEETKKLHEKTQFLVKKVQELTKSKDDIYNELGRVKGVESERLTKENSRSITDYYDSLGLRMVDSLNLIECQNIIKNLLVQFKVPFKTMKEDMIQIARVKVFSRIFLAFFRDIHRLICKKEPMLRDYDSVEFDHTKLCAQSLFQAVAKLYHNWEDK